MRLTKTIASALLLTIMSATSAYAGPVVLQLSRTSPLFNEDPAGAPLPLGRTQYDSGDVLYNDKKIGEYLRVKDVHGGAIAPGTMNVAAVTITIFLPPESRSRVPTPITMQGSHSFDSGEELGSVSATPLPGLVGAMFTVDANGALSIFLP